MFKMHRYLPVSHASANSTAHRYISISYQASSHLHMAYTIPHVPSIISGFPASRHTECNTGECIVLHHFRSVQTSELQLTVSVFRVHSGTGLSSCQKKSQKKFSCLNSTNDLDCVQLRITHKLSSWLFMATCDCGLQVGHTW